MAQSIPKVGRGRGQGRKISEQHEPPSPSLTAQASISTVLSPDISSSEKPIIRIQKSNELGILGKKIDVLVNYFPILQFPQHGVVYRYHIEIRNKKGEVIRRNLRRILYQSWLKAFCQKYPDINQNQIIFDNQTAIFTYNQQLPGIDKTETIVSIKAPNRADRYDEYQFSIKQAGNPTNLNLLKLLENYSTFKDISDDDKNNLRYIQQMLSLVLHEYCSSNADFICNRTFFRQPTTEDAHTYWDLGMGKAAWRGFYSCLVFANGTHQLLMNLDVNYGVFQKRQSFLEFLREVMRHSPCGKRYKRDRNISRIDINDVLNYLDRNQNKYYDGEIEFLLKHCKHLRVNWSVGNRRFVHEITDLSLPASEQTFEWKGKSNQLITVADYYRQQYGFELKFESLPVLKMRNGLVVPMEIVDVEPVKVKKISDDQKAKLTRTATLKPHDYYQRVNEVRNNLEQSSDKTSTTSAWNVQIDTKMHKLTARVLPTPTSEQLIKRTHFPSVWGMINISSTLDVDSCEQFYKQLSEAGYRRGIECLAPDIYEEYHPQHDSIDKIIADLKNMMAAKNHCHFFIIILPEDTNLQEQLYGEVKKLCEIEGGSNVVTQMVRSTTIKRQLENNKQGPNSTLDNLLLKINAKLNEINSNLHVPENIEKFFSRGSRIMYVGIDLCHPPAGTNDQRSIVAAVASTDVIPNRYFKEIYIQNRFSFNPKKRIEYVVRMKEIMKSLIRQYYDKHQEQPPKAIVIYRDGISESEFDMVLEKEMMATRKACVELSSDYQPYLTYIVVNKRHHTRFLPMHLNGNIEAGTVIDSHDVTNATTCDFFLKSHNYRVPGTSRPIHYHVLYDDNKLKLDEIQMLTYALCFLYARTTCAISVPTPVRYANLLAERTKYYLPAWHLLDKKKTELQSNVEEDNEQINFNMQIHLSKNVAGDVPFFV
ncbi:hypothetical protein I4U23_013630 [Adineta vaga]|nr:hypothetical protein I4U23_013630 [Adineta vaga]